MESRESFSSSATAIDAIESSVLQSWVHSIPLRAQGTLLTSMRSCDVAPKHALEASADRELHAFLRYCVLRPADDREVDVPGAWFKSTPPDSWKPSQFGHYPLHWFSHLMHCFEVVSVFHPKKPQREASEIIYRKMVESLHLNPETKSQLIERLTEDRLAKGTVVS